MAQQYLLYGVRRSRVLSFISASPLTEPRSAVETRRVLDRYTSFQLLEAEIARRSNAKRGHL
jgi:hypothetical protein